MALHVYKKQALLLRVVIVVCLPAMLLCQPSCTKGKKKPATVAAPQATMVTVVPAIEKDFPVYYTTIGQFSSPASVKVTAQVSGILEKVHFREGDMVKKGDILFSIDDRPYLAERKKAEASIGKAQSDVAVAQSKLDRSRKLVQESFVSAQDFDSLKQAVVSAKSDLEVAKSDVDIAKIQLAYTKIAASISGKTGIIRVQEGNLAEPGSDNYLVSIVQLDPLFVDFSIPASMGGKVKKSLGKSSDVISINVTGDGSGTDHWLKGSLEFIDNQVDANSGTLRLRGSISNSDGLYWPGQFVTVRLTLDVIQKAIVISAEAIRANDSGAFVYVVDKDGNAKVQQVELGPRNGDFISVASGLQSGAKVITAGQIGLRDGSEVTLVDPAGSSTKENKSAVK